MENGEHGLLQHRLEIDEHIAAADEIELSEGGIGKHVVRRKDDHLADLFGDVVLVVFLDEVLGKPLGRDVFGNALRENAFARFFDGLCVDVGCKDLYFALAAELFLEFLKKDRDRIGFFARRAPCRPDAHRFVCLAVAQNARQSGLLEFFKVLAVAEKARHADQNILDEKLGFAAVFFQKLREAFHVGALGDNHAALDAAQHRVALVVGEVDAAQSLQDGVDAVEDFKVRRFARNLRQHRLVVVGQIQKLFGQALRSQDKVGEPRVDDAARHSVELGALGILRHHDAAVLLNGLDAVGAVGARAGQHDAHGAVAAFFGKRREEHVDRMVDRAMVVVGEKQMPGLNGEILLRRNQVDPVGRHFLQMLGLNDLHGRVLAENLGHQAFVIGREVLHDHKGDVGVCGQLEEKLLQSFKPASGSTDADDQAHIVHLAVFDGGFFNWLDQNDLLELGRGRCQILLREELGIERSLVEVTLGEMTAALEQDVGLIVFFNAFGHHERVGVVTDLHDALDERTADDAAVEVLDK